MSSFNGCTVPCSLGGYETEAEFLALLNNTLQSLFSPIPFCYAMLKETYLDFFYLHGVRENMKMCSLRFCHLRLVKFSC